MILLALGACRPSPPLPAAASAAAPGGPGLDDLVQPCAWVVFGEIHGTAESPAWVGEAAARFVAKGFPVAIGLEVPRDEQPRIDAYLASDGGDAARAALLAGPFWSRAYQDGRSSAAVAGLIERARALHAPIVAFDVAADDADPAPRDARMALRLTEARAADPERALVALVGNLHARRQAGLPPAPDLVPMASLLDAPSLVSLDVRLSGGSFWVCTGPEIADCGVRDASRRADPGPVRVDRAAPPAGYDGVYVVGSTTASPPAAPADAGARP